VKKEEIIEAFHHLGNLMRIHGSKSPWPGFACGVTENEFLTVELAIERQVHHNGWFTEESVRTSLLNLGNWLTREQLTNWTSSYSFTENPKIVAVIMAGNVPLVGFHDFICVLLSGNTAVCKLSSNDKTLLPAFSKHLIQFAPDLAQRIEFSEVKMGQIDAVIATGSDNSTRYFEQYFGQYPHVFRSNRTSIAVLTGEESPEELVNLGKDIFAYFGLGCRNVSHVLLPAGFEINRLFEAFYTLGDIINHHKYANNYDYNRAIMMMNLQNVLDNNFVLLRESKDLFSPLAMLHYQYYANQTELEAYLIENKDKIQAIVGRDYIPFGQAQCPKLTDFADGVDTMQFLSSINN
jgi:hypothetical protein